jgi:hypothetical protein
MVDPESAVREPPMSSVEPTGTELFAPWNLVSGGSGLAAKRLLVTNSAEMMRVRMGDQDAPKGNLFRWARRGREQRNYPLFPTSISEFPSVTSFILGEAPI